MIIHEYFGINIEKVWETAKQDLPNLKIQIEAILAQINKDKLIK
jgi:uncharacterized protein with HEPN domain